MGSIFLLSCCSLQQKPKELLKFPVLVRAPALQDTQRGRYATLLTRGGRIIISGQASCVLNLSDILHQIKRIYYIVVLKGFVSSRILFPKPGLGKRAQPTFRAVQLTVFCVYVCVFISHLLPFTERWCDCSFRRLQLPQVKLLSRLFFLICFC